MRQRTLSVLPIVAVSLLVALGCESASASLFVLDDTILGSGQQLAGYVHGYCNFDSGQSIAR